MKKDRFLQKTLRYIKPIALKLMPLLPESSIDLVLCDHLLELQLRNGIR